MSDYNRVHNVQTTNLSVGHLVKKFLLCYGTRKLITVSAETPELDPSSSQLNPVQTFAPHFYAIQFQTHFELNVVNMLLILIYRTVCPYLTIRHQMNERIFIKFVIDYLY